MKRKKHTPEQIVEKLRRADVLLGQGQSTAQVVQELEVSEQTYYRWRREYGGADRDEPHHDDQGRWPTSSPRSSRGRLPAP